MGKMIMSAILSVFENLSKNINLNKKNITNLLQSSSGSLFDAFENQDFKRVREYYSSNQSFSDDIAVFEVS